MRKEVEAYNTMMQRHYVDVVSLTEPMLERETTYKKTGEIETQIIHYIHQTYSPDASSLGVSLTNTGDGMEGFGSSYQRKAKTYVKTSTLMMSPLMRSTLVVYIQRY